jgi:hypothetical protein
MYLGKQQIEADFAVGLGTDCSEGLWFIQVCYVVGGSPECWQCNVLVLPVCSQFEYILTLILSDSGILPNSDEFSVYLVPIWRGGLR